MSTNSLGSGSIHGSVHFAQLDREAELFEADMERDHVTLALGLELGDNEEIQLSYSKRPKSFPMLQEWRVWMRSLY